MNAATANTPQAGPSFANHEPSLSTLGHSLTNLGPSLGDYGPSTTANGLDLNSSAVNGADVTNNVGTSGSSNSNSNRLDQNSPVMSNNGRMQAAPEFDNEEPLLVRDLFIRADLEGYVPTVEQVGTAYACGDGGVVFRNNRPDPALDAGGSLELGAARPIRGPNGLSFGPALGIGTSRLSRGVGVTRLGLGTSLGFGAGIRPGVLGTYNNRG